MADGEWIVIDARALGFFDANGAVIYGCPGCEYQTGPHRPGSRLANEAMRQHGAAKHPVGDPSGSPVDGDDE